MPDVSECPLAGLKEPHAEKENEEEREGAMLGRLIFAHKRIGEGMDARL